MDKQPTIATRIAFLDYLRIFAFLSVLAGHKFYPYFNQLANDGHIHVTQRFLVTLLLPFIQWGGTGVIVFFLVSGYIIAHVLQSETSGEFLIKRVFRIYPLFIVAVLTEGAFSIYHGAEAPKLSVLIPRLLLIGDVFQTNLALGGVEWTLRVEITFYVFMAALSYLNLIKQRKIILPCVMVATIFICALCSPFPHVGWTKSYLTMYGPFLLLGSMIYLYEIRQVKLSFLLIFVCMVFGNLFWQTATYQPRLINSHFSALAFLLFIIMWAFRSHLKVTPFILFLSDLTYSVYLFHKWLFGIIKHAIGPWGIPLIPLDIQVLIVLFTLCSLLVALIEKPGIRLGRKIVTRLNRRRQPA
ncbi:acyltransferase family protein [Desulfarculus baarsii]